jgi:topoisomerase-4 subunit A
LKPRKIWFDETIQRINVENRGELLGEFKADDSLIIIQQNGILKTVKPNLNMHFPEDMIILEKWIVDKPLSAIYFDGNKDRYFIKRFLAGSQNVEQHFIPLDSKIQLEIVSSDWKPVIEISFSKTVKGKRENLIENIEELISVKGIKALGNQLSSFKIKNINLIEPIPYTPAEKTPIMELEVNVENEKSDINIKDLDSQDGQTELDF